LSDLTAPPFVNPSVTLENVSVGDVSLLQGMNINISLKVTNKNSKSLMMDSVFYKLAKQSDGTVLAEDTMIKRELIRPESTKVVVLPVKVTFFAMGASAKSMLVKGTTKIDINGIVTFEAAPATGDKDIDISFRGNWEIDVSG